MFRLGECTTHLIDEPTAEDPGDDDALVLLLHRQPQLLPLLRLGHRHPVHLVQVRRRPLLAASPESSGEMSSTSLEGDEADISADRE